MKPTTGKGFREKIRAACKSIGTYKPEFETLIERLAGYYLRQKQLEDIYMAGGGKPMVSPAPGSMLQVKNPVLDEIDKLAKPILELERDLGLTPAALRRINEAALQKQTEDPLAAALSGLRGGGGA